MGLPDLSSDGAIRVRLGVTLNSAENEHSRRSGLHPEVGPLLLPGVARCWLNIEDLPARNGPVWCDVTDRYLGFGADLDYHLIACESPETEAGVLGRAERVGDSDRNGGRLGRFVPEQRYEGQTCEGQRETDRGGDGQSWTVVADHVVHGGDLLRANIA